MQDHIIIYYVHLLFYFVVVRPARGATRPRLIEKCVSCFGLREGQLHLEARKTFRIGAGAAEPRNLAHPSKTQQTYTLERPRPEAKKAPAAGTHATNSSEIL